MPESSDFMSISLIKDILDKAAATSKFREDINIRKDSETGQWQWDEKDTEVELSNSEISFLKDQVSRLDSEKAINLDNYDLIKRLKDL